MNICISALELRYIHCSILTECKFVELNEDNWVVVTDSFLYYVLRFKEKRITKFKFITIDGQV